MSNSERDIIVKPLAEVNDVYKEPLTLELPPSDSVASVNSSFSSGRFVSSQKQVLIVVVYNVNLQVQSSVFRFSLCYRQRGRFCKARRESCPEVGFEGQCSPQLIISVPSLFSQLFVQLVVCFSHVMRCTEDSAILLSQSSLVFCYFVAIFGFTGMDTVAYMGCQVWHRYLHRQLMF